ncbi:hypothetical protein HYU93_01195 [Candidatus Daviesbacteria bacterium]|nr:hypothetical protein [Candidatus Daviesbacteria bacterium]
MTAKLLLSLSYNTRLIAIQEELKKQNLPISHPDLLYFDQETKLGISEARKIKDHFSLKPYSAKGRGVVLEDAAKLTIEAQNALLKTLEELPKEATLVLGASSEASLLPTILSRCHIIRIQNPTSHHIPTPEVGYIENIKNLLNSEVADRLEYIEKLKNKEEFLQALIVYFHDNLLKYPEFANQLLQAEEWSKQNVNIRTILEYLMLVMPRIK